MSLGRQALLDRLADSTALWDVHDVCRLHAMHCAENDAAGEPQICSFNFDVMHMFGSHHANTQRQ